MNSKGWPVPLQLDLAPDQKISGKAFSVAFRVLALLLVEGVAWWAYVLWSNGKLGTLCNYEYSVVIGGIGFDGYYSFLRIP